MKKVLKISLAALIILGGLSLTACGKKEKAVNEASKAPVAEETAEIVAEETVEITEEVAEETAEITEEVKEETAEITGEVKEETVEVIAAEIVTEEKN